MKRLSGSEHALHMFPLDTTLRTTWSRLYGFVRSRIGDEGDAEDLVQEVFQQLAASDRVSAPIEDLTAWLFTVARHKVIDWYRQRRPAPLPQAPTGARERVAPEELRFDPTDSPEYAYWQSTVWEELADALAELPAPQRDVFIAHEIDGTSFKQLAERTGEPLNTLLSRKRYAVLFLRERLRDLYDEMEFMSQGGPK